MPVSSTNNVDERRLLTDWELQAWRRELTQPRDKGGVGLLGVHGSEVSGFTNTVELVDCLTAIISNCSLAHAASNFLQYMEYAFIPNFPGFLVGLPPTDKNPRTEADLVKYLPNKHVTLDIMVITRLLSMRGTNRLGHFEVQYSYDQAGVEAARRFRAELDEISELVKQRNTEREYKYDVLDPACIPNAISI